MMRRLLTDARRVAREREREEMHRETDTAQL